MNSSPAVSVILPTHNRAHLLARAIGSVLKQTYKDFELIVVDDGSTDETKSVVASFSDPRIVYKLQEKQSGAAAARNAGIREARASIIAFQDSDDEWLVEKLQRQVEALRAAPDGASLMCCGYLVVPMRGGPYYTGATSRMVSGDWSSDNIYDFCFITPTWCARKEVLIEAGLFDESLPNLEDWEFAFRLYKMGRIYVLNDPLLVKYGGSDSLNWVQGAREVSLQRIIERHADIWSECPKALARLHDELGRLQCRNGSVMQGRANLLQAIKLHPFSLSRWLQYLASLSGTNGYAWLRKQASKESRSQ